jgi:hypothetical protein
VKCTCELRLPVWRPRDHLTACRARHGCRSRPICQPGALLGINARSSPAAFPSSSLIPFPPVLSSSALLTSASFTSGSNHPEVLRAPTNSYDRANEKNGSARSPARVRFVLRNTLSFQVTIVLIRPSLDPTFLAGGLAPTVTSMVCLVFPVAGCSLVRWP